jgi:hypothetical protein
MGELLDGKVHVSANSAAYERPIVVAFGTISECDVCYSKNVQGVAIDTSGEEYGAGTCCIECLRRELNM